MNPKIVTALDEVPIISLADCRNHLRVTPDNSVPPQHPDDDMILALLGAARDWAEGYTELSLTTRTLELALDEFPCDTSIILPNPPLISLQSIYYVDPDGVTQEFATSQCVIDDYQRPGWLFPAYGVAWPATLNVINAVTIRYVAGYSLWNAVPAGLVLPKSIRAALLLTLGALYENREDASEVRLETIPLGAMVLLDQYRVRKGMA